jgi:DNA-binding SARP family transcriptional activator
LRAPGPWIRLLNGFDLICDSQPVRLPACVERLIAFVALHERPLLRPYVAGTLWPERPDQRAAANLRSSLWRLRRISCLVIEATATHIALVSEARVDVRDVLFLAQSIVRRRPNWRGDDLALILEPGELLPGWYDEWVIPERERLNQIRLHALETLSELLILHGRLAEAVEAGLAAVREQPLRESAHRVLIEAYLAEGNQWEAVRQYRRYRHVLRHELGVDPSPKMEDLIRHLSAP